MGRSSFTSAEIDELRRLIREKQTADRSRQKALRARMRRIGFYISDFASDYEGFVVSDLDELIGRGTIEVNESASVEEEAAPERMLGSSEPQGTAAPGGDTEAVARALTSDPVALAVALGPAEAGGVPGAPGFYAWWAARGAIPGLPHHPHPRHLGLGLLYVGISPARPSSRGTIRSRVAGQHVRGNTSSSTFRFVLASLLLEELSLTPRRAASKVVLDRGDNDRLREWQREHLSLTWCVRELPWEVEGEVIALMEPPLNSAGNKAHPFYSRVRSARVAFRATAVG